MTLLIAAGDKTQIHLSSDYRLSERGRPVRTINGAKQITINSLEWAAQLAFTGIATDGRGYDTRTWIVDLLSSLAPPLSLEGLVRSTAERAAKEIAGVVGYDSRLTIVIGAAEAGACRLFVVSNWEPQYDRPLDTPTEAFEVYEVDLGSPTVRFNGIEAVVPRAARRHLTRLVHDGAHPRDIRNAMVHINRAAARTRIGAGRISQECSVHSLLSDGQSAGTNDGAVAGLPSVIQLGFGDFSEHLLKSGLPGLHPNSVIRQVAGYRGPGTPLPPATGDERSVPYSSSTVSRTLIVGSTAQPLGTLSIQGESGTFGIRKNGEAIVLLARARFELAPAELAGLEPFVQRWQTLPNPPTIDGAQPRSWEYPFELIFDGTAVKITMSMSSLAFRSANHAQALSVLGPNEELTMAAPLETLSLTSDQASPIAEAPIHARFQLRDFPELSLNRRPI